MVSPLRNVLGRTNWNTDFTVDRPYRRHKLFFTIDVHGRRNVPH